MKKIILCTLTSILAFTFIPNEAKASTSPIKTEMAKDSVNTEIKLINRLAEIKATDKSTLSNSEKREMRKEVRSIDKQMRHGDGVIYISGGALILIIVLLIILL